MSAEDREECSIPETYLSQLLALGLWYSPPMRCFDGGVWIYKPVTAGGNSIPGYKPCGLVFLHEGGEEQLQPDSDAAKLALFKDSLEDRWVVSGVDGVGGMCASDFVGLWTTLEEAINDIKDFYFGDAARMNLKAAFYFDPRWVT